MTLTVVPAEGTVRSGLDGAEYEIDLNEKHAEALRDALVRYVNAGRRVSGSARGQRGRAPDFGKWAEYHRGP